MSEAGYGPIMQDCARCHERKVRLTMKEAPEGWICFDCQRAEKPDQEPATFVCSYCMKTMPTERRSKRFVLRMGCNDCAEDMARRAEAKCGACGAGFSNGISWRHPLDSSKVVCLECWVKIAHTPYAPAPAMDELLPDPGIRSIATHDDVHRSGCGCSKCSKHYQGHPSGIEPIAICKHETFIRGNLLKYILRAPYKGDELKDMEKAKQYLDWEIERIKAEMK